MNIEWKGCIRLGVTVFLTFLAIHYWSNLIGFVGAVFQAASALILGCVIAYVLNILMSFYEKHYFLKGETESIKKNRRIICLLGALLTLIAVVALIIGLVVPELVACFRILIAEIPPAIDSLIEWLERTGVLSAFMSEDSAMALTAVDWQAKVAELGSMVATGVDRKSVV